MRRLLSARSFIRLSALDNANSLWTDSDEIFQDQQTWHEKNEAMNF